jgi:hypothetical protein
MAMEETSAYGMPRHDGEAAAESSFGIKSGEDWGGLPVLDYSRRAEGGMDRIAYRLPGPRRKDCA